MTGGQKPQERPVAVRETRQRPDGTLEEVLVVDGEVFPARSPLLPGLDEVVRRGRGRRYGRRPR